MRQKTQISAIDAFGIDYRVDGDDGPVLMLPGYTEPGAHTPPVKDYEFDPDVLFHSLVAYLFGRPLLCSGPSGTGKTEIAEQICARLNLNRIIVSSSDETETSDLTGMPMPQADGSVRFMHGSLVRGLCNYGIDEDHEKYDVVLWDEMTKNRPGVLAKYNALLEGRPFAIDANGGEIVHPDPHVWLVGTANSAGMGDRSGMYAAEQVQDAATLARFLRVELNYPDEAREREIVKVILPEDLEEDCEPIVQFMNLLRSSGLPTVLGVRQSCDIALLYKTLGSMEDAVLLTIAYALDRFDDRRTVANQFQTAFGVEAPRIAPTRI